MSKLNIEGKLIGTTADKVEYANNGMSGVADAKAALDNLHSRLANVEQNGDGSSSDDEISNSDLALLAEKMLVAGGVSSNWWCYEPIRAGSGGNPNYEHAGEPGYADMYISHLPQESHYYRTGTYFRVYKGDTVYYQDCGTQYNHAIIITDLNLKVLYAPHYGIGSNLNGIPITEDGYVCAIKDGSNVYHSAVWAEWSERKTLANKPMKYMAYGDSISIDKAGAYLFGYPKIAARILGAKLDKMAVAGMHTEFLLENVVHCPSDADIVTMLFGANDVSHIIGRVCKPQTTEGSVSGGTITYTVSSAYMAKLIKNEGLVIQGNSTKLTGISINGTSVYSNADGFTLSNNSRFITADNDVDISTLSSGDVIAVTVVDQGGGTFELGPAKQVGDAADILAIEDVEQFKNELMVTFVGRYRYAFDFLLSILKKPTAKVFCIGTVGLYSSLDDTQNIPERGTAKYIQYRMALGTKDLIAGMNEPKLVFLDGTRLVQNWWASNPPFFSTDRTHPNQEGQTILGVNLAVAIADVLGLDRLSGVVSSYNAGLPSQPS